MVNFPGPMMFVQGPMGWMATPYGPVTPLPGPFPVSGFIRNPFGPVQRDGSASQCRSLIGSDASAYNLYCTNPLFDEKPAKGKKPAPSLADASLAFKPGVEYSFAKNGAKLTLPAPLRNVLATQKDVHFTVQRLATAGGPQVQYNFFLREAVPTGTTSTSGGSGSLTPKTTGPVAPRPGMGTVVLDLGVNLGATIVLDRVLVMGGVPDKLRLPVMLSTHYLASLISTRSLSSASAGVGQIPLFTGFRFMTSEFLDLIGIPKGTTANDWASLGGALTPFALAARFPALQTAFASAAGVGMQAGKLAPGLAGGAGFLGGCSQALGAAGALLIADYVGDLSLKAAIADNPDKKLKNFLWDASNQSAGGFSGWLMGNLPTMTKLIQAGAATVSGNRGNFNDYLDRRAEEAIDGSRQFGETMETNLVRFSGRAMDSLDTGGLELHERYVLGLLPENSYNEDDKAWMERQLARDPNALANARAHFWQAWIKSTENRIAEVYQDVSPVTLHDDQWNEFQSSEYQMVQDAYNLLAYTAPYASKAQKIRTLVDADGTITDHDAFRAYMMEQIPPRLEEFANSLKPALLQLAMESISTYPSGNPDQPVNLSINWWDFESKVRDRFTKDKEVIGVFLNLATLDRMSGAPKATGAQELAGLIDKYGQIRDLSALKRVLMPLIETAIAKKAGEIDQLMKDHRLSDVTEDKATGTWSASLQTGRLTPTQMYFIDKPETRQMVMEYEMLLQIHRMFEPGT